MTDETAQKLIEAIYHLATTIGQSKTTAPRQVAPQAQPVATKTAPQQQRGGDTHETLAIRITRGAVPFKKGGGFFYKGVITLNGVEVKISLGVRTTVYTGTFYVNQIVHCVADNAGADSYGEIKYWLTSLTKVETPTPIQQQAHHAPKAPISAPFDDADDEEEDENPY